jgi:pimeloyl-ACP methyl ester carboxylesterase
MREKSLFSSLVDVVRGCELGFGEVLRRSLHTGALAGIALSFSQLALGQDEHKYQFADIAGNRIAWSCEGEGEPLIVLIAGGGLSAHDSFGRTYHSYDGPGRICMYDRAGMGKSTFANPKTRTLEQLTAELHELSVQNGWGDKMLVPHSFGGFIARAYAGKYPDEVSGVLFLDVAHEDWLPRLKAKMALADYAIMDRIVKWNESTIHEDYVQAQEAVRSTKLRRNLPITVITRGLVHSQIRLERMSYDGIDLFDGEHKALQAELAKLTSNSQHRVARYASHIFDQYDPWLVNDEIKSLAERVMKGK